MLRQKQAWIALSIMWMVSPAFAQENANQKQPNQTDAPVAASGAGTEVRHE